MVLFCVLLLRATTHSDLVLRAVNAGIPYKVVHNASIMNAVGCCGLQVSACRCRGQQPPNAMLDVVSRASASTHLRLLHAALITLHYSYNIKLTGLVINGAVSLRAGLSC